MKVDDKIKSLKWIRIFTPVHIPKYLVEQIKNRKFTVEDFYKFQELACVNQTNQGISLNPLSHLYVLVDDENQTKGFLWFTVNPLSKDIWINNFSMDKEYWGGGRAVNKLSEFIKNFRKKADLNNILWITYYPKHSERHGFKESKSVLMEYDYKTEEKEDGRNIHRGSKQSARCSTFDTTTTTIHEQPELAGAGATSGSSILELSATV